MGHEMVRDVGREINGESNAHDEIDHGYAIKADAPQGHPSHYSKLNRHN